MLYIPLILSISLVAFGYTQDIDIQTTKVQSNPTTSTSDSSTFTTSSSSSHSFKPTTTSSSTSSSSSSSSSSPASTSTSSTVTASNGNTATTITPGSAVHRALTWLLTQRDAHDYSYRNDTARAVIALRVAATTVSAGDSVAVAVLPSITGVDLQLTAKQLEIEIVILLWRHHEIPITPPRLAVYTLALSALCRDPRQFHGHDLIGTLQHHEPVPDLDFAQATLAACTAKAHIRKKQIRRLLDIANAAKDHNIDTVAVTIMTLKCIVRDHRHRNWLHSIRKPSVGLARQQLDDGSFGNVYNTALALQALHDIGDLTPHWNRTAAVLYLESKQDPDGAFTDPGLTSEVALALMNRGINSVRAIDCGNRDADFDNHVELDSLNKAPSMHGINDSDPRNITITYSLWVGTNVTDNSTITLTALRNTSFYSIMQMAADADPHYTFEASQWPNGHYVHTIAGYKEEPMGYHYWLLYRLTELPDPQSPPANQLVAPVGVDDLLIDDGDHFLFWYKKL